MNSTVHNRTILLIAFMVLVGFLSSMNPVPANLLAIISAVGGPLFLYIGVKGKGSGNDAS